MPEQERPTRPNLENLRKQAKSLHKQFRSHAAESVERVRKSLPRIASTSDPDIIATSVTLQEVQHVIATEQGFSNWKRALDAAGNAGARRSPRALHSRPGLANVIREAAHLITLVGQGKPWPVERVRRGLPRLADMTNSEIAQTEIGIDEAKQVLALEFGYKD